MAQRSGSSICVILNFVSICFWNLLVSTCIAILHTAVFKLTLTNLRSFFHSFYLDFCNYGNVNNYLAVYF